MSPFDLTAPSELIALQKWFASIITRPIDANSQMDPISPSGKLMSEEAPLYIQPNKRLTSEKRIQIYQQQYWWRLLSTLHQNFPALTALFGYTDFNLSIGIPFLGQNPSNHWSLSKLGDRLPDWLKKNFTGNDKLLVVSLAEIDWGYQQLFYASPKNLALFKFPYNFFALREILLKESVEHWENAPSFPPLSKKGNYFFLLFRTDKNHILYKEIDEWQWNSLAKGYK